MAAGRQWPPVGSARPLMYLPGKELSMARKSLFKKKSLRQMSSSERANRTILTRTMILMVLCGVLLFVPLIATLYNLMIVEHDKYEEMAIANQTRKTTLTASRGVIYDRNMNILASSSTVETIFLDPNALVRRAEEEEKKRQAGKEYNAAVTVDFIARGLGEILDVEPEFVRQQAADTKYYYKVIKRKVPEETAQKVREFITEYSLSGIINLEMDSQRYYPYTSLAAQIMGFVRSDNVGAEGLEAYYDGQLTGNAGAIITTKGNNGSEMLYTYEKYYDASDGNSLVLTLDTTVQHYLEKNLEEAVAKYDVQNGAFGIVMDANTGEILGMATLGSYDPNNYLEIYQDDLREELEDLYQDTIRFDEDSRAYKEGLEEYNKQVAAARLLQWRNRCVSDGYEPGSVFKLITLAAGLDCGVVTENDHFVCNGFGHIYYGRAQPVDCWKHGGHGDVDTKQALAGSCNPSFASIGVRVGGETFYDYVEAFGFLDQTGIDLPGEAKGLFFNYGNYTNPDSTASLISSSFGQTFRITPIQMARAVAAVVNGGYLMEPYVVREVQDADGNTIESHEPTVVRQVISEETSATMRTMMEYVVTDGTAGKGKVPGYRVGGKTGTSEKIDVFDENGERTEDKICSFVGVAPIDDPQYVVLVALDSPSRETGLLIGGGAMAAPTVAGVMTDILPYLGIEPDVSDEDLNLITLSVPDLSGMTEAEAAATLSEKSFTYRKVGEGAVVMDQIPAVGALIPGKSEVILYFSQEAPDKKVKVPDFTGMTLVAANNYATSEGLYMLITGVNQDAYNVAATYQDPAAGTEVPLGTTVTVEFTDFAAQD